jgi:hypothetical protein
MLVFKKLFTFFKVCCSNTLILFSLKNYTMFETKSYSFSDLASTVLGSLNSPNLAISEQMVFLKVSARGGHSQLVLP